MELFESYPKIDSFLKIEGGKKLLYRPLECFRCKKWIGVTKEDEDQVVYVKSGSFMGHKDPVETTSLRIRCPGCNEWINFTIQKGLDYF